MKNALAARFPSTPVRISRPAVVIAFAGGEETWEVIPGFVTGRGGHGVFVYDIPGAATGWLDTAPLEHLAYVNEVNSRQGIAGGAKKLARLIKAWKYYNDVPISSFTLRCGLLSTSPGSPVSFPSKTSATCWSTWTASGWQP